MDKINEEYTTVVNTSVQMQWAEFLVLYKSMVADQLECFLRAPIQDLPQVLERFIADLRKGD